MPLKKVKIFKHICFLKKYLYKQNDISRESYTDIPL